MSNLKRLLLVALAVLLVLAILAFVLENRQSVSLLFLGWAGPELPVSICIVLAFLVGMVIGPLLGLVVGRRKMLRKRVV